MMHTFRKSDIRFAKRTLNIWVVWAAESRCSGLRIDLTLVLAKMVARAMYTVARAV